MSSKNRIERRLSPWLLATKSISNARYAVAGIKLFRNWLQLTRLYTGVAEMAVPFVAQGRNGFTVTHWEPADIQTTWVVFCASTYRIPKSCGLILDLGANIGAFSIFAAKIMGAERIIALEPVSETFDKLRCNFENNGLESRVITIRKGIGGSTGPRTIHLGVSSPHSSMYYRNDPRFESGRTEEIEVISLDQLFEDLGIESVDFCKMDCEGGEVEALLAASDDVLRRIHLLSMEYHFPANLSDETTLFRRLSQAGFRCVVNSRVHRLATFINDPAEG